MVSPNTSFRKGWRESNRPTNSLVLRVSGNVEPGKVSINQSALTVAAVEYKNFTLYFFPIVMRRLLPKDFYDHFMLFVNACRWLSSENVTPTHIAAAKENLRKFVVDAEKLYGKSILDFVVHSVLHLPYYVLQFGPLWVTSNFGFEGLLKTIKGNLHGTTYYNEQFVRVLKTLKYTAKIESELQVSNLDTAALFADLHSDLGAKKQPTRFWHQCKLNTEEAAIVRKLLSLEDDQQLSEWEFVHHNHLDFNTKSRGQRQSSCDSSWIAFAIDQHPTYGRIERIFRVQSAERVEIFFAVREFSKKDFIPYLFEAHETEKRHWIAAELAFATLIAIPTVSGIFLAHDVKFY